MGLFDTHKVVQRELSYGEVTNVTRPLRYASNERFVVTEKHRADALLRRKQNTKKKNILSM